MTLSFNDDLVDVFAADDCAKDGVRDFLTMELALAGIFMVLIGRFLTDCKAS